MRTSTFACSAPRSAMMGALAACTTMGTGVGTERSGDMKANFAWKSTDDRTGTLTANLSNGDTYSGQFFQVTHDTRVETLGRCGTAGPVHGVAGVTGVRIPIRHSSRTTAAASSRISLTSPASTCVVTSRSCIRRTGCRAAAQDSVSCRRDRRSTRRSRTRDARDGLATSAALGHRRRRPADRADGRRGQLRSVAGLRRRDPAQRGHAARDRPRDGRADCTNGAGDRRRARGPGAALGRRGRHSRRPRSRARTAASRRHALSVRAFDGDHRSRRPLVRDDRAEARRRSPTIADDTSSRSWSTRRRARSTSASRSARTIGPSRSVARFAIATARLPASCSRASRSST